jgi:hypothetical protein
VQHDSENYSSNLTGWFIVRLDPSWFSYYGQDTPEPFRGDEGDEGGEDDEDSTQSDGKQCFTQSVTFFL